MSDVRFEVKTDLAVLNQITLEANFEQLDESLELMMADYQNMVVTPDSLALAKAERAKIRKTIEQINSLCQKWPEVGKLVDDYFDGDLEHERTYLS